MEKKLFKLEPRGKLMPSNLGNVAEPKCLLKHLNIDSSKEPVIIRTAKHFDNFYKKVIEQPLSSFARAMELKCRSLNPIFNEFFNIDYVRYNEEFGSCTLMHNIGDVDSIYDLKDFPEYAAERFRISIPSSANEAKTRDIVAHELGHLYSAVLALEDKFSLVSKDENYRIQNQKMLREFLIGYLKAKNGDRFVELDKDANVIASFILNKRVIFCVDKACTTRSLKRSYEDIVIALKSLKTE